MYQRDRNPLEHDKRAASWIAEQPFDVGSMAPFARYAVDARARSVVFDWQANGAVAAAGTIAVYVGNFTGGLPWATLSPGEMLTRLLALGDAGTVLTLVPSAGATGLLQLTLAQDALSPGRFKPRSGGGGGAPGVVYTPLAFSASTIVVDNNGGTLIAYPSTAQFALAQSQTLGLHVVLDDNTSPSGIAVGVSAPTGGASASVVAQSDGNVVLYWNLSPTSSNGVAKINSTYGATFATAWVFDFTYTQDAANASIAGAINGNPLLYNGFSPAFSNILSALPKLVLWIATPAGISALYKAYAFTY